MKPKKPIEISRDAQTAGGPRSDTGKRRSSRNAIKHGILSDAVVLPGESREQYESLLQGLIDAKQPVGALEEVLVGKVAEIVWRQRRGLVAEGAEIREGTEVLDWNADRGLISRIEDPRILTNCLQDLCKLRADLELEGLNVHSKHDDILMQIYGPESSSGRSTLRDTYLEWFQIAATPEAVRQDIKCATPEQCKDAVLAEIDKEVARLRAYEQTNRKQSAKAKLQVLRHAVPDLERLDRLLRYEAHLDRSLAQTLKHLEREQSLRKGQPVAPRIEVDVSA